MRWALAATLVVLALGACTGSGQSAPDFQEAYGVVDQPCAATRVATECTAHVLVVNRGGAGLGHATIAVPLSAGGAASAARLSSARCGAVIPDVPSGGYADITCQVQVPAGDAVAGFPSLASIDYVFSTPAAAAPDQTPAIAALALSSVAALLALVALLTALVARRRT